ncbi:MAG: FHA domain-containing protein [Anaerolineae bacterium]|nr:FHA domain-containing protein [Anaerolineae bacterium]MDW8171694.1 FHA domain-containing protein [Anaerolineae bacterium]
MCDSSQSMQTGFLGKGDVPHMPDSPQGEDPPTVIPWVIEFRVVNTPYILRAPMSSDLLLGRADPEHDFLPDVDLTNYEGRRLGVSRQHARITTGDNRVTLTDLNSANGSYINGFLLEAERPYRIHDGDRIRLGRLELQVRFIVKPSEDERTRVGLGNLLDVPLIGQGQKVLVAEENPEVCRLLQHILKQAQFQPLVAHDMTSAMLLLDEQRPQALIAAADLSDNQGLSLVSYFNQKMGRLMPSLVIVNSGGGYLAEQALQAGGDMIVWKPVAVDQVISGLVNMVRQMTEDTSGN